MNLIEGIQAEQARVRGLLREYEAIGPAGIFGAAMLKQAIKHGDRSIASGDIVDMLTALEELRECKG